MKYVILPIIIIFFFSCDKNYNGKFADTKHNLFTISCTVKDSTYNAIFDTGTEISSFPNRNISPSQKELHSYLFSRDTIIIEYLKYAIVTVGNINTVSRFGFDLSEISHAVIGNDIIQKYYWKINFVNKTFSMFSRPILFDLERYTIIPYTIDRGNMVYCVDSISILIDTGASVRTSAKDGITGEVIRIGKIDFDVVSNRTWDYLQRELNLIPNEKRTQICSDIRFGDINIEQAELRKYILSSDHPVRTSVSGGIDIIMTLDALKRFGIIYIDPYKQLLYLKK
ncbi:MAG: hypothetical protein R3Y59_07785 [bacterium]